MKRETESRYCQHLFYLPITVVLLVIGVYPTIYYFYLAFHSWRLGSPIPPEFCGLNNFVQIVKDPIFWLSLSKLFYLLGGAVAIETVLGLGIALLLAKEETFERVVRSVILIPMVLAPVIVGVVARFFFNPDYGMVNYLLNLIGIKGARWFTSSYQALPTLILVDVWQWTPFAVVVFVAVLHTFPREQYEAALIDGASSWKRFKYLTLPFLKIAFLVVIVFRSMDMFRLFDVIYVTTEGGPANATLTLPFYLYYTSFKFFRMGYGAAIAVVLFGIVIALSSVYIKVLGSTLFGKGD